MGDVHMTLARTIALSIVVTLGVITGFSAVVVADKPDTIKVGIYQNAPKLFMDENDQPSGFFPDLLNHIGSQRGWLLEYVPCSWNECLTKIENGSLDLMMDVAHSDARALRFDFNQEVVLSNWSVLYVRKGSDIHSIMDVDEKLSRS